MEQPEAIRLAEILVAPKTPAIVPAPDPNAAPGSTPAQTPEAEAAKKAADEAALHAAEAKLTIPQASSGRR